MPSYPQVPRYRRLTHIVAFLLLFLAGVELFACEIASPDGCEISQTSSHPADDCCLCCCMHVLVTDVPPPSQHLDLVTTERSTLTPPKPSTRASKIYHPPQN